MYGPTADDVVLLADTGLCVRVEKSLIKIGDECKFGGGKSIREAQAQRTIMSEEDAHRCADMVICNAVIIDYTGIYKADIGIKDGLISGIGSAANSDTMHNPDQKILIGACTDVIDASRLILTAGVIDSHVHFICPQLVDQALHSGVTT